MLTASATNNTGLQQNHLPTVLVVDDEPANRLLLERILQRSYQILTAEDGLQALEILAQETVDTVLLDISMPGMNGLEVLQHLRSDPATADLPIIMVSALSDTEDIVRGLELGASDYVIKPINIEVVQARVKTQVTLKILLDEKQAAIRELEAAQAMRQRLFRVASHDLKAPLANIRMAEYILRDSVKDDPLGMEILDTMVLTIENMQEVINGFLDAAAFENGKLEIEIQNTVVHDQVLNVILQYQVAAENKNITLDIGALAGNIYADTARFKQIMGNLISNAIKYSPLGSCVSIWAENLGNKIRVNVADQGKGIPVEERHLLFQEYGKLSTRPTADESSTGLGLWIVKQLVTLQNGQVGVDCPADGGSIFWVEFPTMPIE